MIADALVIAVLLVCIFWGSKQGIAKMFLNILGWAISFVAGVLLYNPVRGLLEAMEISKGIALKLKETGAMEGIPGIMLDRAVPGMTEGIYMEAANTAVSVISFVAVLIIVRVVLFLITLIMGVASNLPVIHQINGLAGGIAGFFVGVVVILVAFAAMGAFEAFGINQAAQIFDGSNIAWLIYNNNPLLGFFV